MLLLLEKFKSTNPDFKPPVGHNGEEMELFSVEPNGTFLVARYFTQVPIEGPRLDRYFVDLFLNDKGLEVFRVTAKIMDQPPPPPKFGARLRYALRLLFS